MGSRSILVSRSTTGSSPFSYTESTKPKLKDTVCQRQQENTNRKHKRKFLSGFRSKKDKAKSTPPLVPPRTCNEYHAYEATSLPTKDTQETARQSEANMTFGQELNNESPDSFAEEEVIQLSGEHIYESPDDVLEQSLGHAQQSHPSLHEVRNGKARVPGRPNYDAIEIPVKSRATISLPTHSISDKKMPARHASLSLKTTPTSQTTQEDDMGVSDYRSYPYRQEYNFYCTRPPVKEIAQYAADDYEDVGEEYALLAENIEYEDVDISEDLYDDVQAVNAADTKAFSAPLSVDDDGDDLCTDSCDVSKLSLISSPSNDDKADYFNLSPERARPEIKKNKTSRLNVCQQDCASDDQDARYVTTSTSSTLQHVPSNPRPKPKPRRPKPSPRPRSSLKSEVPQNKPVSNKIPPQPAEKSRKSQPKELPEIQRLLDEAQNLIKTARQNNSTELTVTSVDFTARRVGHEGGRLQLKHHGVTLDIPPGALTDPEMVYIYVQRSLDILSMGEEGFASPLVHCGASGLTFNAPVVLTFPVHLEEPSAWDLRGIQSNAPEAAWEDISSESSSDSLVVIKDGLCTMVVDHFTLHGVSVRPKELRGASGGRDGSHDKVLPLRVGLFLPSDQTTTSRQLQLKLRIWDESEESSAHVQHEERGSKTIDKTCRLFLRTSEGSGSRQPDSDLEVSIRKLDSASWKSDPMTKVIPYEHVCSDPCGRVDVCETFNLTLKASRGGGGALHPLTCDFVIRQRALGPRFAQKIRAVVDIHDRGMSTNIADISPNPMSAAGFRRLCEYLDREKRWKLLADNSFGTTQGRSFDTWECPSTAVLNVIFSRLTAQDPNATLKYLETKLRECRLPGAAEIVLEEWGQRDQGQTGSKASKTSRYPFKKSPQLKHPVQCSGEDESQWPTNDSAQQESVYEVVMLEAERDRIAQAPTTPNRVSQKKPEENDEELHHTLSSIDPPAPAPSFASRRQQVPIQQEWPENSHEQSDNIYEDMPVAVSSRNQALKQQGNKSISSTEEYNYSDVPLKDQPGSLESPRLLYVNASVVRMPPSLPKGYYKLEK